MRVITGEQIQAIADHSIILDVPSNGLSDIVTKQLANTKCQYTRFQPNETITLLPFLTGKYGSCYKPKETQLST